MEQGKTITRDEINRKLMALQEYPDVESVKILMEDYKSALPLINRANFDESLVPQAEASIQALGLRAQALMHLMADRTE